VRELTTIAISRDTKNRLAKLGTFGQSYEDIVKNLLERLGMEEL